MIKKIIYICLLLGMVSCSQKKTTLLKGYSHTLLDTNLQITTELNSDSLILHIYNPKEIYYKLRFNYKYTCEETNGYINDLIYKGSTKNNPVILNFPDDNFNCDKIVSIKIFNALGNVLYKTPLLKSVHPLQIKDSVKSQ